MRIIAIKTLKQFWEQFPDSEQPLRAWHTAVKHALWLTPNDVKVMYRNASIVGNNRAEFNIKGNTYRLVVAINYAMGIVFIRFIGTHQEYDSIDVTSI
jgi:mRNA interferase HigB